jgi:hypothetical protein
MKPIPKGLLRYPNSSGALAEHEGLLRSANFPTHGVIAEHAIYSRPEAERQRSSPPLARVTRPTRFAPLLRLPPYGSGSQQRTLVTFMDGHRTAHGTGKRITSDSRGVMHRHNRKTTGQISKTTMIAMV